MDPPCGLGSLACGRCSSAHQLGEQMASSADGASAPRLLWAQQGTALPAELTGCLGAFEASPLPPVMSSEVWITPNTHTGVHTHAHNTGTRMHTGTQHRHVHTHAQNTDTQTHAHIYRYMAGTSDIHVYTSIHAECTHLHADMCTHVYACMNTNTHRHVSIHMHTLIHRHTHMHQTHINTCTCIHAWCT